MAPPAERTLSASLDLAFASRDAEYAHADAMISHVLGIARALVVRHVAFASPVVDGTALAEALARAGFATTASFSDWHFELTRALRGVRRARAAMRRFLPPAEQWRFLPYRGAMAEIARTTCVETFGVVTQGHLQAVGELSSGGADMGASYVFADGTRYLGSTAIALREGHAHFDPVLTAPGLPRGAVFAAGAEHAFEILIAQGARTGGGLVNDANAGFGRILHRVLGAEVRETSRMLGWVAP